MKEALYKYLKTNRLYLAIMTICMIVFFVLMYQVVLYADDYSVGINARKGLPTIISAFRTHYMEWGGGYTPTIVSVLLLLGPVAWKVGVVLQVALIVALASRMVSKNDAKKRSFAALVLWMLFFCTSVSLLRETVLWLDGSSCYLFTTLQTTIVFYFMYTRLFQKVSKKYDFLLIPLISFFGGWSSAQSGCIVVLAILVLILYRRFIGKEKVGLLYYISLALSIVGFAIFYFAPGNYVRLAAFDYYSSLSLPKKILFRLSDIYTLLFNGHANAPMTSSFFIMFAFGALALLAYNKVKTTDKLKYKKLFYVSSIVAGLFVFGYMLSFLSIPQFDLYIQEFYLYPNLLTKQLFSFGFFVSLIPYAFATLAIIATIINSWLIAKSDKKKPFVLAALLVALAADFAMVFAPYSPVRTIIYSVVFAWIITAYALHGIIESKVRILPLAIVMLVCIDLNLALLFAIVYVVIMSFVKVSDNKKHVLDMAVYLFCLLVFACGNYATLLTNYYLNRGTDNFNINLILEFKEGENDCALGDEAKHCEIVFARPQNSVYTTAPLVGEDWIEISIREYFELPENVIFKYEDE